MISRRSSDNIPMRNRSGQTLVIAIMVMFIVALVAAVFIGLVARNLFRSGRYSDMDAVAQIGEAGVRYADKMLTSSEEGADWRPKPDNDGVTDPGNVAKDIKPTPDEAVAPDGKLMWEYKRDKYPDFRWTRAYWPTELPTDAAPGQGYAGPTGGYTTFNTGQGRYLLRVSYNPKMNDPLSKYIKIESIGRLGVFERDDPTTYKPYGNVNLRREITAYKPIGVTDYLRFVTNKDNRKGPFPLGCPGFLTDFGRSIKSGSQSPGSQFGVRGGPVRVNGDLLWYGTGIELFLRSTKDENGDMVPIDRVEIAGSVSHANVAGVDLYPMDLSGIRQGGGAFMLSPSEPPDGKTVNNWTADGFYRDSYPQGGDARRRIKRLEPPLVDQADPTNTTTRYRLLTLNSGERITTNGKLVNVGEYGWGRGIYIGNTNDQQSDSQSIIGGFSLRSDWLRPGQFTNKESGWHGPYYIPLGAVIVLHPNDTDGDGLADLSITRTDSDFTTWYDAWGYPRPEWGRTVTMPYPNPNGDPAKNGRTVRSATGATKHIDGNGVVYAEGNIRIRGMLPKAMQLTVVSGQNIYIEGNLLKYRDSSWSASTEDNKDPYRGADRTCGLALLAKQYVCVNTTQFFSPQNGIGLDHIGSDAGNEQPPYHLIVTGEPDSRPRIMWDNGPWESEASTNAPSEWFMLLRHSGQLGTSYINAWLNPGPNNPMNGLLGLNTDWGAVNRPVVQGLPAYVWGIGDPAFNFPGWGVSAPGWGIGSAFACETFPLSTSPMNANLRTGVGEPNLLQIALDQTSFTRNNYLLGGMAVLPLDIRIEAVIYAQEGSFFVLPGNWFNPNPSDVPGRDRPAGMSPRFPYYREPLDIRVIVDGAISENTPAAIGDVAEWMSKWGKIPQTYGSSGEPTAHAGEGLTFLYDDHAGWPVTDPLNGTGPIRTDAYGRTLPFAPRLPVSGSLIYFGDVM